MNTTESPAERRCRHCGATSGLRRLVGSPLSLAGPAWECADGCPEPSIKPFQTVRRAGTYAEAMTKGAELTGAQNLYRFPNGYGASVVRSAGTYGATHGLWEMAVLTFDDAGQWELTYETPLTDDVIGHLSDADVQEKLRAIRDLPAESDGSGL